MHIITKKRIKEAQNIFPDCKSALSGWYRLMEKNTFTSYSGLRDVFSSVDKVDGLYVFDVGGNKLRIITSIHFNRQKVYIRQVLTHKEYDNDKWKKS